MFDIPLKGRDDAMFRSDSVHVSQAFYVSAYSSDLVRLENIILSRGAVRGLNYILSLHVDEKYSIPIVTLHTTTEFVDFKEDWIEDSNGYIHIEDQIDDK